MASVPKLILICVFIFLAVGTCIEIIQKIPDWEAYNILRGEGGEPLQLVYEDTKSVESLFRGMESWYYTDSDHCGVPSALVAIGWNRTLENAINLLTYKMPNFSWISSEDNKKAISIASARCIIGRNDGQLHYSKEYRLIWVVQQPNCVVIILNEKGGYLHEELSTIYPRRDAEVRERP